MHSVQRIIHAVISQPCHTHNTTFLQELTTSCLYFFSCSENAQSYSTEIPGDIIKKEKSGSVWRPVIGIGINIGLLLSRAL